MLPKAAVSIIRVKYPSPSILIMERSRSKGDPWSGQLCFPGGRWDPSDQNLLQTAIRETKEECGITLYLRHLKEICPHGSAKSKKKPLPVAVFAFEIEQKPKLKLDVMECHAVHWLEETDFLNPQHHTCVAMPQRQGQFMPCIELGNNTLWGFSYEQLRKYYHRKGKICHFTGNLNN